MLAAIHEVGLCNNNKLQEFNVSRTEKKDTWRVAQTRRTLVFTSLIRSQSIVTLHGWPIGGTLKWVWRTTCNLIKPFLGNIMWKIHRSCFVFIWDTFSSSVFSLLFCTSFKNFKNGYVSLVRLDTKIYTYMHTYVHTCVHTNKLGKEIHWNKKNVYEKKTYKRITVARFICKFQHIPTKSVNQPVSQAADKQAQPTNHLTAFCCTKNHRHMANNTNNKIKTL